MHIYICIYSHLYLLKVPYNNCVTHVRCCESSYVIMYIHMYTCVVTLGRRYIESDIVSAQELLQRT